MTTEPHRAFVAAVEAHDWDAAVALLHDDVVFLSPAVFSPYQGKEATTFLLSNVAQVFEDLRYTDVLTSGDRSAALVFAAGVGDRSVQGVDHIRWDEDGRIVAFTVFIRPLSGLIALAEAMQARIAAG